MLDLTIGMHDNTWRDWWTHALILRTWTAAVNVERARAHRQKKARLRAAPLTLKCFHRSR